MPKISLCELGFLDTGIVEDIAIAGRVGATGLGLVETKLRDQDQEDLKGRLADAGITATTCTPEVFSVLPLSGTGARFGGASDPATRIRLMAKGIERLSVFGPDAVLCTTGPVGSLGEQEARAAVIEGLRHCADVASDLGTKVGIEPMREDVRAQWTLVCSLRETMELIEDVGRDNVGIVLDIWHMWDSPNLYEDLASVVDWLFDVQVNDYRSPTRAPRDRLVAGDGVADVPRLLRALRERGYDGWYDMEVFSDDGRFGYDLEDSLWKLEPLEFARRQVEGFWACWRRSLAQTA